jgi:AcrR family transcriptional regulator
VTVKTRERLSADERREQILEAARREFAARGLYGTSTEDIAKRAGITQPYVFRLFGTKKDLFIAACERTMEETHAGMRDAAVGKTGKEALEAMGHAYIELLEQDPRRLMLQMHMYAAAEDPDVGEAAETCYGRPRGAVAVLRHGHDDQRHRLDGPHEVALPVGEAAARRLRQEPFMTPISFFHSEVSDYVLTLCQRRAA